MGLIHEVLAHFCRAVTGTASIVRRLQDLHGLLRTASQQGGILGSAANNLVGDHCLIGINSHMLHRDLLLPTTAMVI